MIYSIFIYNRSGQCIFYEEWNRTVNNTASRDEEQKLMYGMLWSLKSFVKKSSPVPEAEKSGFHFYKTNASKVHFFETASNYKFLLTTDAEAPDQREFLRGLYKNIYVEYVIKNPLYKPGEQITCDLFKDNLQREVRGLPIFKSLPKGVH